MNSFLLGKMKLLKMFLLIKWPVGQLSLLLLMFLVSRSISVQANEQVNRGNFVRGDLNEERDSLLRLLRPLFEFYRKSNEEKRADEFEIESLLEAGSYPVESYSNGFGQREELRQSRRSGIPEPPTQIVEHGSNKLEPSQLRLVHNWRPQYRQYLPPRWG